MLFEMPWYYLGLTVRKVRKGEKIRDRYNQSDTTPDPRYQWDITNESQEVSPFPAGDHKASINRRACKHNENKTEKT